MPKFCRLDVPLVQNVRSLKQIAPRWTVHGLDKNANAVRQAKKQDSDGHYVTDVSRLKPLSYDVIFCMSVLCRFPGDYFAYTFPQFAEGSTVVDGLLKPHGILVLYNAQYSWASTRVGAELYSPLKNEKLRLYKSSGFVPKMHPDGRMMSINASQAVPWLYRKKLEIKPLSYNAVSGVTKFHVKFEGKCVPADHPDVQPWYPSAPGRAMVPWNWPGFKLSREQPPTSSTVTKVETAETDTKRKEMQAAAPQIERVEPLSANTHSSCYLESRRAG